MKYAMEVQREVGGRWIAEVMGVPGAMAYGRSKSEARRKARALAVKEAKIRWFEDTCALRGIYVGASDQRKSDMFDCSIELLSFGALRELVRLFGGKVSNSKEEIRCKNQKSRMARSITARS